MKFKIVIISLLCCMLSLISLITVYSVNTERGGAVHILQSEESEKRQDFEEQTLESVLTNHGILFELCEKWTEFNHTFIKMKVENIEELYAIEIKLNDKVVLWKTNEQYVIFDINKV